MFWLGHCLRRGPGSQCLHQQGNKRVQPRADPGIIVAAPHVRLPGPLNFPGRLEASRLTSRQMPPAAVTADLWRNGALSRPPTSRAPAPVSAHQTEHLPERLDGVRRDARPGGSTACPAGPKDTCRALVRSQLHREQGTP